MNRDKFKAKRTSVQTMQNTVIVKDSRAAQISLFCFSATLTSLGIGIITEIILANTLDHNPTARVNTAILILLFLCALWLIISLIGIIAGHIGNKHGKTAITNVLWLRISIIGNHVFLSTSTILLSYAALVVLVIKPFSP